MKSTDVRKKNHPSLYETALCIAIANARQDELRWELFIDNLSQICDTFAYQIATKGTAPSKQSNPSRHESVSR